MTPQEVLESARTWIASDPEPAMRAALQAHIDRGDAETLLELMSGSLRFGTAGLRAAVGPGPMRMNRAVVRRTTAGVARYLKRTFAGTTIRPVVVAADARTSSSEFLREAVGVLAAHGLAVRYFNTPISTPVAAYAARTLNASACIVITASHNPKEDNGYKLYDNRAIQIVPPVDTDIAAEIALSAPANEEPVRLDALEGSVDGVEAVGPDLVERYYADVAELRPDTSPCRDLRIAYTPLHGVGAEPVTRVLADAGFVDVHVVEEQREPDGTFPTVAFPNPEEPGTLDHVTELARTIDADIVIANDPDVDRLAASLKMPSGQWVALTGNQIGVLLADFTLQRAPRVPRPLVAQSIVSSPMLRSIAQFYGAQCEQTLTGFKWIWTAALDRMESSDVNFVFGYEEALGYCAGRLVRDKDGISAALLLCELAALEKSTGSSLRSRLEGLYRTHGLWVSAQHCVVRTGLTGARQIEAAMDQISSQPPTRVLNQIVTGTRDFRTGGQDRPRWLENTSLIELSLGDQGRVLVRPSGTEPKLKCYVDLREPIEPETDVWAAQSEARDRAQQLAAAVVASIGLG